MCGWVKSWAGYAEVPGLGPFLVVLDVEQLVSIKSMCDRADTIYVPEPQAVSVRLFTRPARLKFRKSDLSYSH